jgi:glycosyltransferase involved in cell wall biosynthesis
MKIAYLGYSAIPSRMANSIHVMKMCAALGRLDHEVKLFVPNREQECEPNVPDPYSFYGVERVFEIEKLAWPRIRFRSFIYSLSLFLKVRAWNPDVIYSRYLPGSIALGVFGNRSVFETHAPVWEESRLQEICLRLMARSGRIPVIVSISSALRNAYQKRGIKPREGFVLAPDAADNPSQSAIGTHTSGRQGRLRIGYVGQLYPGKGMEVVEAIAPRLPEHDFHIVGGYPADVESWKVRIPSENVFFHGFVPPVGVGALMDTLDVCLLPNQRTVQTHSSRKKSAVQNISQYTSPLKLFEYMARGKSIVSSRLPVLQEVLDDSTAIFADPEKPDEWVAAVRRLADPDLRSRLGRAAREAFLKSYTWDARAAGLAAVLVEQAKGRSWAPVP